MPNKQLPIRAYKIDVFVGRHHAYVRVPFLYFFKKWKLLGSFAVRYAAEDAVRRHARLNRVTPSYAKRYR